MPIKLDDVKIMMQLKKLIIHKQTQGIVRKDGWWHGDGGGDDDDDGN